jgi:hypothetical protein
MTGSPVRPKEVGFVRLVKGWMILIDMPMAQTVHEIDFSPGYFS